MNATWAIDMSLPPEPSSPAEARSAVLERFSGHRLLGELLLCVSEIVTNAVLHAGTELRFSVSSLTDRVRVEVADGDPGMPIRKHYDLAAPTGRGILLIEELADGWGVDATIDGGKVVWFELLDEEIDA
jgi:anti-sigma regulatory factor (Ser/Thr protein kinase)